MEEGRNCYFLTAFLVAFFAGLHTLHGPGHEHAIAFLEAGFFATGVFAFMIFLLKNFFQQPFFVLLLASCIFKLIYVKNKNQQGEGALAQFDMLGYSQAYFKKLRCSRQNKTGKMVLKINVECVPLPLL